MRWGLGTPPTSVGSSACALSNADDAACRACSSHLRIGQRARLQPGLLAPKHERQARRRERAAAGPSRAGARSARQPRTVCRITAGREAGDDGLCRRWLRSTRQARASGRAAGGMRSGSTVVIVPLQSARQQVCGVRLGEAAQAAVHAAHAAGAAREADAAGAGGERLLRVATSVARSSALAPRATCATDPSASRCLFCVGLTWTRHQYTHTVHLCPFLQRVRAALFERCWEAVTFSDSEHRTVHRGATTHRSSVCKRPLRSSQCRIAVQSTQTCKAAG